MLIMRTHPFGSHRTAMPAAPTIAADAKALADELARAKLVDSVRLAALLAEFAGGDAAALVAHL